MQCLKQLRRTFALVGLFLLTIVFGSRGIADAQVIHEWSGIEIDAEFGWSIGSVGDTDGDGVSDVLIAAPQTGFQSGAAYLYSGMSGASLFAFAGAGGVADFFGAFFSDLGDVDADGRADFVIGSPGEDSAGIDSGRVYVYSGRTGTPIFDVSGTADAGFGPVCGLDDLNADGIEDFLVGASGIDLVTGDEGSAFVYSGKDATLLQTYLGPYELGGFGWRVASLGDIDGDGVKDFAVSARRTAAGSQDPGRVFQYSGKSLLLIRELVGEVRFDDFGISVADTGDLDQDSCSDFLIGASGHDAFDQTAGRAYLYSGKSGALMRSYDGDLKYAHFGASVSGAGDVNADGVPDFLIGAFEATDGLKEGQAFLYSGKTTELLYEHSGTVRSGEFGASVDLVGDLNADGHDDLLVGAPKHDAVGHAFALAGRFLYLNASRSHISSGQTLSLTTGEATPGSMALQFITAFNGTPIFHLAGIGILDANGRWTQNHTTPSGFAGDQFTLTSFVLDSVQGVLVSNAETIAVYR